MADAGARSAQQKPADQDEPDSPDQLPPPQDRREQAHSDQQPGEDRPAGSRDPRRPREVPRDRPQDPPQEAAPIERKAGNRVEGRQQQVDPGEARAEQATLYPEPPGQAEEDQPETHADQGSRHGHEDLVARAPGLGGELAPPPPPPPHPPPNRKSVMERT